MLPGTLLLAVRTARGELCESRVKKAPFTVNPDEQLASEQVKRLEAPNKNSMGMGIRSPDFASHMVLLMIRYSTVTKVNE